MPVKKTDAGRSKATKIERHLRRACTALALQLLPVLQPGERIAEESGRGTMTATRFMEGLTAP